MTVVLEAWLQCWCWWLFHWDAPWQNAERKVVLRLYGELKQWASDLTPFMLERSTFNSKGSWAGLLRVSMFQTGGSGSEKHIGSKPPFRCLGHTTWSPHCRSLHTPSWLRCPQALLLGMPSIIALICPLRDRGMCSVSSLSHAKA